MNGIYLTPTSWVVLAFIFIFLIFILYKIFSRTSNQPTSKKYNKFGGLNTIGACPICGIVLEKGEKVITGIYKRPDNDNLCYIYGCPHCYHVTEPDANRRCPVCKKEIGPDSYLIARNFVRGDGTERIHILGCTKCRRGN